MRRITLTNQNSSGPVRDLVLQLLTLHQLRLQLHSVLVLVLSPLRLGRQTHRPSALCRAKPKLGLALLLLSSGPVTTPRHNTTRALALRGYSTRLHTPKRAKVTYSCLTVTLPAFCVCLVNALAVAVAVAVPQLSGRADDVSRTPPRPAFRLSSTLKH